jgi:molybdopterin molybdotransferase
MISVSEARKLLADFRLEIGEEEIVLESSSGRVLSRPAIAPLPHPFFDQTAVDGYAFRFSDWKEEKPLKLVGETPAGDKPYKGLKEGEAIRIFTGAPVPLEADTVVMQEYANKKEGHVLIDAHKFIKGANIRLKGEQLALGDEVLAKGHLINENSIGLLASFGLEKVFVNKEISVGIVVTGDEFATGAKPEPGQIFESNGIMLSKALEKHACNTQVLFSKDNEAVLKSTISKTLERNDLLCVTGGVSVGDYDFTPKVLEDLGFEIIFHKVTQKPGKPLLFAHKGKKLAFGLPGNPRAVMICFYQHILPLIHRSLGIRSDTNKGLFGLAHDFTKKDDGKTHFLAGRLERSKVHILGGQASHMLKTLAEANVLVELGPEKSSWSEFEKVPCLIIS